MLVCDGWQQNAYCLLDAGDGQKCERWGLYTLLRPDPQAIWPMQTQTNVDAHYIRSKSGGGHWEFHKRLPEKWNISYRDLTFVVRPTGFKHTGLFPEQAVNWDWMREQLGGAKRRVLNLFAYTGGATCACLKAGAEVVHVDAAKGMLAWTKENLSACRLQDAPVRLIADDAMKFVLREQRRGNRYDAIVMDPPSYGRGPTGEMWKMEQDLYPLVHACSKLLSDNPCFFLINSYTTGLAPSVLHNVLQQALPSGHTQAHEVVLPIVRGGLVLPCGASGRWLPCR